MRIICKSAVSASQLSATCGINKDIELQLLSEIDEGQTVDDILREIHKTNNYRIRAVHSPICSAKAVNLNEIMDSRVFLRLSRSIALAGELSAEQGIDVLLVVHNTGLIADYETNTELKQGLVRLLRKYLLNYPLLSIGIENVTPLFIGKSQECNRFVFKNGCLYENVDLVKYLRGLMPDIEPSRIGTVLDVCHSQTTIRVLDTLLQGKETDIPREIDYFEVNKPYIKEIHLADVIDFGIPYSNHGIAYADDRRELMLQELQYYKDMEYSCDIVIEVRETDYIQRTNFRHNYKMLKEVCNELKIPVEE